MRVDVRAVPRRSSAPDEYEDATFPAASAELSGNLRVAVADGATTSSFAGDWARLLVSAWADGTLDAGGEAVPGLARRWRESVDLDGLSWFAADKLRAGSHAALIGLELRENGSWTALSVGDCCLFVVRADTLIESFPARRPEELDGRPALIGTGMSAEEFRRCVRLATGWWQAGDTLCLMSDALGRWFLHAALVAQSAPWRTLQAAAERPESFLAWIERLRQCGALQPDDVTLLSVFP